MYFVSFKLTGQCKKVTKWKSLISIFQTFGLSVECFASYNIFIVYSVQRDLVIKWQTWQTRKKSRLIPLQFEAYFICTHSSRHFTDHLHILQILFQERRATSLSGFPTGSILVSILIMTQLHPRDQKTDKRTDSRNGDSRKKQLQPVQWESVALYRLIMHCSCPLT